MPDISSSKKKRTIVMTSTTPWATLVTHAYDCKVIERILKAKAVPRTLESIRNEQAAEELRKALPQIKQRPLDEYITLLGGLAHEKNNHRTA